MQQANTPFINMDVGDVLLMRYDRVYHVALIVGFSGEKVEYQGAIARRNIIIQEWNYIPCKGGSRIISLDDEHIWGVLRSLSTL